MSKDNLAIEVTITKLIEPREPWTPQSDPDGYTEEDVQPKDWYLDTVLNFTHGFDDEGTVGSVSLTVTSGGVVVSGIAISRQEWIQRMVELYRTAGAAETAPHIGATFGLMHEKVIGLAKSRRDAKLPTRARGFLHMRDVRLGAGDTYTQAPLWRGKMSDITGWSMGSWNGHDDPSNDARRHAAREIGHETGAH